MRLWLPLLFLATPAAAQLASPLPSAAYSGTFHPEPLHTRILFAVDHLGLSDYYGDFTGAGGTLVLDVKNPAQSRVEIAVPVASVSTTNADLDKRLRGPDWLDAAHFPTMVFRSTRVTPTGPRAADIEGTLTLHGVTKPLVLHAKFHGAGISPVTQTYAVGFDATGQLNRADFGVSTLIKFVPDPITITISAEFDRA